MIEAILLFVLMAAAVAGCLFMIGAAVLIVSSASPELATAAPAQPVTILKPLHGDEARTTFCGRAAMARRRSG